MDIIQLYDYVMSTICGCVVIGKVRGNGLFKR